jgi:hypothetical protein
VAASGEPAQFIEILHKARSDGVEKDVTHQFQEVGVFLAKNRLNTILEQVTGSSVSSVEPHGIAGQKTTHYRGDRHGSGSQEQVEVVGNQGPCITSGIRFLENSPQSFQEMVPVLVAAKYLPTFNAPDHHMMQGAGSIYSGSPWHNPPRILVNSKHPDCRNTLILGYFI